MGKRKDEEGLQIVAGRPRAAWEWEAARASGAVL